jgi:uncharacterized membrane protein HdeD (DUF308 family)
MTEPIVGGISAGSPVADQDGPPLLRPVLVPWWLPLSLGVLSVLFGVVVLAWPGATLYVFAVLVGFWLVVIGVARVVGAFVHRPDRTTGQQVLSGVIGVVYVIGGVMCLRHLVISLLLIVVFVSLQWLLGGITDVVLGVHSVGAHRWWLLVIGVLSIALGVVFAALPALSLTFFVVFTGISSLVLGVMQISSAFMLRRLQL